MKSPDPWAASRAANPFSMPVPVSAPQAIGPLSGQQDFPPLGLAPSAQQAANSFEQVQAKNDLARAQQAENAQLKEKLWNLGARWTSW